MREIKYRAWHKPTQKMFDVFSLAADYIFEDSMEGIHTSPTLPANTIDCELLQFIGFKDWKATEIYEGDILSVEYRDQTYIKEVRWNQQGGCFYLINKTVIEFLSLAANWNDEDPNVVYLTKCEKIGNIYQNPELLKS